MPSRLLILTTDLARGGTPSVVRDLAVRLRDRGRDVEAACLAGPGDTSVELSAAGVPTHPLYARGPLDVRVFVRLARLIRERGYTHVFSLLLHANAAAAVVRPFLPRHIRYFQSIQTTQPDPAWHWTVQRLIARSAERIIAPSPSVIALAGGRCHIPGEKLTLISNAVDLDALSSLPRSTSARTRVAFLGRLDPIKRVGDLLQAMPLLANSDAFELHIYGDGPERLHLEHVARNLFPTTFHGTFSSPARVLPDVDLLVLPSAAEGFGLVLIEAMAACVPVIASDAPGIRDVVSHEQTGLLYPTADAAALAAAIQRLAGDSDLAARLTQNASRDVRQRYAWPGVLDAYESALAL